MIDVDESEYYNDIKDDITSMIIEFYFYSLKNSFDGFNFNDSFELLKKALEKKLNDHALLTFDDFAKKNGYNIVNDELIKFNFEQEDFTYTELYNFYVNRNLKFKNNPIFWRMKILVKRLSSHRKLSLEEKIILFDDVIHCYHLAGGLFEFVDTEQCKKDAYEMFTN